MNITIIINKGNKGIEIYEIGKGNNKTISISNNKKSTVIIKKRKG